MARLGCGICFGTLDPQDVEEAKRAAVRCQRCSRLFHQACWTRCTNPACRHGESEPAVVEPPTLLPDRVHCVVPIFGAPTCSLRDQPLGISTGAVQDDEVGHFVVCNNSDQPVAISPWIGPPWLSWRWKTPVQPLPVPPSVEDENRLVPGETRTLEVHFHGVRPTNARLRFRLGQQYVELRTMLSDNAAYIVGLAGFWIFLVVHLIQMAAVFANMPQSRAEPPSQVSWYTSLTIALHIGWTALIAPAPYRKVLCWIVLVLGHRLDGWQQRRGQRLRPVHWMVHFLIDADFHTGFQRVFHRLVFALLVGALAGFGFHYALCLFFTWTVLFRGRFFFHYLIVFLVYVLVLLTAWSYWLWTYGVDLSKRIPRLGLWLAVGFGSILDSIYNGIRKNATPDVPPK